MIDLDLESLEKIKALKKTVGTPEFLRFFTNPREYIEFKKSNKGHTTPKVEAVVPHQVSNDDPLDRLMSTKDVIDADMILDMDYSDWSGDIDLDKLINDMHTKKIQQLSQIALQTIIEKHVLSLPHLAPQI